jgi:cysteamine dioxygenase
VTLTELLRRAELGVLTIDDLAALAPDAPDLCEVIEALEADDGDAAFSWRATTLHEDSLQEVALFALLAGHSIPLHDHPGMTVHQRVLRGALEVEAWDLLEAHTAVELRARHRGIVRCDASTGVHTLTATEGNLHRVMALEDTVFLDVLAPPYGAERRCTEWRVVEAPGADGVGKIVRVRTL